MNKEKNIIGTMDTATVWHAFNKEIYHYILSRLKDSDQAKDILQEVFIKIHLKLDTLTDKEKLGHWIYRITKNAITDHFRLRKDHAALPDLAADERQDIHTFEKCLAPFVDQLDPIYRDALRQTELGDLSQKEYAEQTGSSYSTVKSRVQRGKQQLHALFIACCRPVFDRYGNVVESKKEVCLCGCSEIL